MIRANEASAPVPAVYEPCICLIARGSKRVSVGDQSVEYSASRYLLVSLDLPLFGHVLEATATEPYLCCQVGLDRAVMAQMVLAEEEAAPAVDLPALAVGRPEPDLLDAVCRLIRLLERPETIATLAPLVEREIVYRLLIGPHGPILRRLATGDGHLGQISRATEWIRRHFRDPLRVADVAAAAGMSTSSLHEHFKLLTSVTPLEFQKQLRLHEARRLMLAEGANAGTAGFAVGYESPSQFSREYRRLFGAPPRRDIERLLAAQ